MPALTSTAARSIAAKLSHAVMEELHAYYANAYGLPTIYFDGYNRYVTIRHIFEGIWDLEEDQRIYLDVMQGRMSTSREDRDRLTRRVSTQVILRYKFDSSDQYESDQAVDPYLIDELLSVLEDIDDALASSAHARLTNMTDAVWISSKIGLQEGPIGSPFVMDHLIEMRQLTAILEVTYDVSSDPDED